MRSRSQAVSTASGPTTNRRRSTSPSRRSSRTSRSPGAWRSPPGGDLFLTERTGRILRLDAGDVRPVARPRDAIDAAAIDPGDDERPWWVEGGEGGTLGVAVHPDYPDPSSLYVYYTAETDDGTVNRVARYDPGADEPERTREVVIDGIPADRIHNGGRIAFGPEGALWVLTGDAGEAHLAGGPTSLAGKVLRVTPGGEPASENPGDGDPRIYTVGHRNPQGIAWLPDGTPIATEHGPEARDEVNLLEPGADYGWPRARGGPDYESYADEYAPPVVNTGPDETWAPSGAVFYTGDAVSELRDRLLIGGLRSQQMIAVTLTPPDADPPPLDGDAARYGADWLDDAYQATAYRLLDDDLGRIRHVAQGPDGEAYAITSNRDGRARDPFPTDRDDVLVRLRPA